MRPLSDFHYELPPELIAKRPLEDRAGSRLLIVDRASGTWKDARFEDFPALLGPGDCLVLNNTRVIPARLLGHRQGHTGRVEILLVRRKDGMARVWQALVRPARKLPVGATVDVSERLRARIVGTGEAGERDVELLCEGDVQEELFRVGHVPLPPYLNRPDEEEDRERYQTVFAKHAGSSAAPTAGLHFTPRILARCLEAGADRAEVTLHVGLGTFLPLTEANLKAGKLHSEYFEVGEDAAQRLNRARRRVCVGTTSVRTLETAAQQGWPLQAQQRDTQIFIREGFPWKATDALLTNFHLPESSLLMLVASLAGHELTMAAYRHAVEARYRFFSYGDAMLVL